MTREEAIAAARAGAHQRYDGDLRPALGDAAWDPEEQCWAVRVAPVDVPFSCGVECCGIEIYAVVAVAPSTASMPLVAP